MSQISPEETYKSLESDQVENKTVSKGILPTNLWEVITAFCNAEGGLIRLGVNPNGKVEKIDEKDIDKLQRDLITQCKTQYSHPIYPEITTSEGVIECYIPPVPAALRPIYAKSRGIHHGSRVRVGTVNAEVDDEWIRRFSIAANGGAEIIEYSGDYLKHYDQNSIRNYMEIVQKKRGNVYKDFTQEEVLSKLRAISEDRKITLFGLLAFSNTTSLQELVAPTVNIAVTQYAGTSKVNPTNISEVSLDDKEFGGNVLSQFEQALIFIQSKLPVRSKTETGGKRLEYLAIPVEALRETLANALAHRDYTTTSSRIQVDIYADRIEFINPGKSLVPLDQLESAPSQTRNPLLMNHLRDLGITEQRARGIKTIKNSLKQAGLAEPNFNHRGNSFIAVLYSSAFITNDDQMWLQKFKKFSLKENQLNALVHLRHNPDGISNSEYRNLNNMNNVRDDIRAKKELAKLVQLGLVKPMGENKYRKYKLG